MQGVEIVNVATNKQLKPRRRDASLTCNALFTNVIKKKPKSKFRSERKFGLSVS